MSITTIRMMVMAIFLAWVSSYIVYFGFTTNYTARTFSPESFTMQYDRGIYKYRILSQYLLIHLDRSLAESIPSHGAENRILLRDQTASERFYFSYYYLNLSFLVLIAVILTLLINLKKGPKIGPNKDSNVGKLLIITKNDKNLIIYLSILVISLSQFVITPYDNSSYFFQLLIIYVYLKYFDLHYIACLSTICLLLVLSTLNRESSLLSVSFLAVDVFCKYGLNKRSFFNISLICALYLATYFSLRYIITPNPDHYDIDYLNRNLTLETNKIGMIWNGLLFYLSLTLANTKENKALILLYHIFSLPYIWSCFTAGVLWEIRLYIPLFLGSLLLGKLDTSLYKIQLTSWIRRLGFR